MTRGPGKLVRAAGALVADREGRVLLVQQEYGQRRWGLPGGIVHTEDLPTKVVVHEVRRETGLEIQVVDLVGLYHLSGTDPASEDHLPDVLTYAFRCEVVAGEPVLNAPGRISRLGWHAADALPTPATVTSAAAVGDLAAGLAGVVRAVSR